MGVAARIRKLGISIIKHDLATTSFHSLLPNQVSRNQISVLLFMPHHTEWFLMHQAYMIDHCFIAWNLTKHICKQGKLKIWWPYQVEVNTIKTCVKCITNSQWFTEAMIPADSITCTSLGTPVQQSLCDTNVSLFKTSTLLSFSCLLNRRPSTDTLLLTYKLSLCLRDSISSRGRETERHRQR